MGEIKIPLHLDVTAVIPTRDRYFSTLPLVLSAIASQTMKPSRLIIYDDGEKFDLRNNQTYSYIFQVLQSNGINWGVAFGDGKGQAHLHNRSIHDTQTEFIWRIDDDCVPEPDVLEKLYYRIITDDKIGAVAGIVAMPGQLRVKPAPLKGKLDDVFMGQNVQWYASADDIEVEHLYSSFLYRKAAATHGYRLDLSRAGHREETIFSHQMHLNGWKLVFTPSALTWHFRNKDGGIRTVEREGFEHDENVFQSILRYEWKVEPSQPTFAVLDNGIGDHYAFKHVLELFVKKNAGKRIVIACCYPEVFHEYLDVVEICSIGDARALLGEAVMHSLNIYVYMADRHWQARGSNIVEAYKQMYGL